MTPNPYEVEMEFWEFLLQKEGDRSWLPLESPDVEILEGRYRVVARSSRVSTAVEVRITHEATAEKPPMRRVQKRTGHTNPDGLIVVIPFTRMQPGLWELRCTGDLLADMLGESWQQEVKLQVLAHASEMAEDWDSDWQGEIGEPLSAPSPKAIAKATILKSRMRNGAIAASGSNPSPKDSSIATTSPDQTSPASYEGTPADVTDGGVLAAKMTDAAIESASAIVVSDSFATAELDDSEIEAASIFEMAERMSERVVESIFADLDVTDQVWEGNPSAESGVSSPEVNASTLQLRLERDAYAVDRGQSLTLTGQIESLEGQPGEPNSSAATELQIRLRDPQNSQVLVEVHHPLPAQPLPFSFACTVAVPTKYQTRLLLGELRLVSAPEREGGPLATQSFSVTADLDELLEAIANSSESDILQPPLEFLGSSTETSLNLAFLELLDAPKPFLQLQTSGKQPLPPQIYQPDPVKAKLKPIELPFYNVSVPPRVATTLPIVEKFEAAEVKPTVEELQPEVPEIGPGEIQPDLVQEDALLAGRSLSLAEVLDASADSSQGWNSEVNASRFQNYQNGDTPVRAPSSPEDTAFQSLNLQSRFWSRLSALATDTELSTWLKLADPLEPFSLNEAPMGLDTDLAAQEIVVDDSLTPSQSTRHAQPAQAISETSTKSSFLAEEESVPLPRLDLPAGELTSGKVIHFTVKLPNLQPRIYVKLWVQDRQTRSLLDGPRWLVDFSPTGLGDLESRTQVTIPFGCLEIQFEAIAVEMATQRESHKVTINREVVPPDLPNLSLDELDA